MAAHARRRRAYYALTTCWVLPHVMHDGSCCSHCGLSSQGRCFAAPHPHPHAPFAPWGALLLHALFRRCMDPESKGAQVTARDASAHI